MHTLYLFHGVVKQKEAENLYSERLDSISCLAIVQRTSDRYHHYGQAIERALTLTYSKLEKVSMFSIL